MPRLVGAGFLTALALAMLLSWGGREALASHVQCGDVTTQDTTLDSDLIDCPGEGIVIGADAITLISTGTPSTARGAAFRKISAQWELLRVRISLAPDLGIRATRTSRSKTGQFETSTSGCSQAPRTEVWFET